MSPLRVVHNNINHSGYDFLLVEFFSICRHRNLSKRRGTRQINGIRRSCRLVYCSRFTRCRS
ncbi:hypothetical protein BDR07DRAFT_1428720 [Suillus spraguei]|nr:hypothetical protein BDR07DRAFT_1429776 [Suillus spraguei]KAG2354689.1 hypothetical protein BDR07DRAFT_1428720 [Suillus spraguei]